MTGQEQALIVIAAAGVALALWLALSARELRKLEREIAERKAAERPAE
jgi:hypothetical protein